MKNGFHMKIKLVALLALLVTFSNAKILNLQEKEAGDKLIESEQPSFVFFKENLEKDTDSDFKAFQEASVSLSSKAHFILGDPNEITGEVMLEHLDMDKTGSIAFVWVDGSNFHKIDIDLPVEVSELEDIYQKHTTGEYQNYSEIPISSQNIVNLNPKNWEQVVHNPDTYSVVFFTKKGCDSCTQVLLTPK